MSVDAVIAEVVNHKVEVKTEMNMKTIMKIIQMRTMMKMRETVTGAPVVTNMTGMKMRILIITAREEVDKIGVQE